MNARWLICLLLSAALFLSPGAGFAQTAEEMLTSCRTMLKKLDDRQRSFTSAEGVCFGSFDTLSYLNAFFSLPKICPPEYITGTELARVYLEDLDQVDIAALPIDARKNWLLAAVDIFQARYPC